MKSGLIMEGGALRGMFTAGVIDVMMENKIKFDGAIGVSAGAAFGCNYKSNQIGRVIRYNKRFCNDKRYCGWGSWLKTGDFYNAEFDYNVVPKTLDIFDSEEFGKNPMEFYVVATDANTGKPVYQKLNDGGDRDLLWIRASASMPVLARLVDIDGNKYSDGGTSDSIPIKFFEKLGYDRNIVILTQPEGFIKKKNNLMPIINMALRKYPNLVDAIKTRHERYNETTAYISKKEKEGSIIAIRPPELLEIKPGEKNPDELERVYQIGRKVGIDNLDKVKDFLSRDNIFDK